MTELHDTPAYYFKVKYGLNHFVETGCYKGAGLATAFRMDFLRLISCDINETWVDYCRHQFDSDYTDFFLGASHEALPKMCRLANGYPTLFFLDAHLPDMYGMATPGELERMPIAAELEQILKYKQGFQNDVIICDDMRIIKSDDNPRWTPGETICCEPVEGITIQMLESIFTDTHDAVLDPHAEGMLIFTPK